MKRLVFVFSTAAALALTTACGNTQPTRIDSILVTVNQVECRAEGLVPSAPNGNLDIVSRGLMKNGEWTEVECTLYDANGNEVDSDSDVHACRLVNTVSGMSWGAFDLTYSNTFEEPVFHYQSHQSMYSLDDEFAAADCEVTDTWTETINLR